MRSQRFDIPFGYGLNQDTSKMIVEPPYLTVAQNVELPKAGGCFKRPGFTSIPLANTYPGTVTECRRLVTDGSAVFELDHQAAYPFNGSTFDVPTGMPAEFCTASETPISSDPSLGVLNPDIAYTNGCTMVAWTVGSGSSWSVYAVVRTASGAERFRAIVAGALTVNPYARVVAFGSKFYVLYGVAGNLLKCVILDTTATSMYFTTSTTVSANYNSGSKFDVAPWSATGAVMAYRTTTPQLCVQILTAAGATGATLTIAEDPTYSVCVGCQAGDSVGYVGWSNVSGIRAAGFNMSTIALAFGPITVDGTIASYQMGACRIDASNGCIAWGVQQSYPLQPITAFATVTSSGALGAYDKLLGLFPSSKPFAYRSNVFIESCRQTDIGFDTHFLVERTSAFGGIMPAVAVHFAKAAKSASTVTTVLSSWASTGTGSYSAAIPTLATAASEFPTGCGIASVNFLDNLAALSTPYANGAIVGGGVPTYLSTSILTETGFHYGPDAKFVSTSKTAGTGSLSAGTYLYKLVYVTVTPGGEVVYSEPSVKPITVTTALNDAVNITPPFLYLTRRTGSSGTVMIEVYRTQVNSSGPYFRLPINAVSAPGSAVPTLVDTSSDVAISTNNTLYADGLSVLVDQCPPASTAVATFQDRCCLANGQNVYYSKIFVVGNAPRFNNTMVFRAEGPGNITAMAGLDSNLIVFKRDSIFSAQGAGFDDAGNGQNFYCQRIASDVGCVDPRSVVLMPLGLMFQSVAGIYLLSRDQSVTFIGAPIRDLLSTYPVVTSAVLVAAKNQVRFTLTTSAGTSGTTAVYDYLRHQWLEHTVESNAAAVSAVTVNGTYYYAKADGNVRMSSSSLYTDVGASYPMAIETAWISPTGLQGFYRARRVHYLGDYLSSHGLALQVAYNGQDIYTDSRTWSNAELSALPREQVAVHLVNQKCSSLKIRVEDTGATGQSYNMVGLALEWVPKQGNTKLIVGGTK